MYAAYRARRQLLLTMASNVGNLPEDTTEEEPGSQVKENTISKEVEEKLSSQGMDTREDTLPNTTNETPAVDGQHGTELVSPQNAAEPATERGDVSDVGQNEPEGVSNVGQNDTAAPSEGSPVPGVKKDDADAVGEAGSTPPLKENETPVKQTKEEKRESLLKQCEEIVTFLKAQTEWDTEEVLKKLKRLSNMYWKPTRKLKIDMGNCLAEHDFGGIAVRMLRYFNEVGVFKNDTVWFPTYFTYMVSWNYSDACLAFAQDLVEKGLVNIVSLNIAHKPYLENQNKKNVLFVLKASLSILQNLIKVNDARSVYEAEHVKEHLEPLLHSDKEFFKATATMVITAIINEEENKMLEDTGAISFMVKGVDHAVKSTKKRRYRGFTPTELMQCLSRMAVNDSNKVKIVDEGCLPLLVSMLQYKSEEEQIAAAKTVWTLSFAKDLVTAIKAETGMMETLELLTQSENSRVKKLASGALWVLKEEAEHREKAEMSETDQNIGHIFISYSWSEQDTIIQLKDALKASGYQVWVDVEQMGGSTLDAMASGIENASVVLVCASEKYKMSPNCRTEAEYTFQQKKAIVPLMVQRRYRPDGWLGFMMGAKFYVNFDGKYEFAQAFEMLTKELDGRGKLKAGQNQSIVNETVMIASAPATFAAPPISNSKPQVNVKTWDKDKVTTWRKECELNSNKWDDFFSTYDGKRLSQLRTVKDKAPEFFYSHMVSKLDFELPETLDLSEALDNL